MKKSGKIFEKLKKIKEKISNNVSKRLFNIPFRYILLFTLINTIFLFYFGHVLIRVLMFLFCVLILYFFGQLPFADVDPVPFTSALNHLFFGLPVAIQYAIWVCPIADAITGNINQWTFVTLFSIIASLLISSLFPLNSFFYLIVFIILYNLIRFVITIFLGGITGAIISTSTNTIIYILITNFFISIINFATLIFKK
ncbi:MAG: hypothetical protein QW757_02810 [Candidatus Woesearchaeota archaeon]